MARGDPVAETAKVARLEQELAASAAAVSELTARLERLTEVVAAVTNATGIYVGGDPADLLAELDLADYVVAANVE